MNPWFSSFLASSNPISRKSRYEPQALEIKDSTDTDRFASYLDLHLEIENEVKNETLRQKR
jgi:hypothetical protein